MEYILVKDDDGHWYVIPDNKILDWYDWVGSMVNSYSPLPIWAKEVGGSQILVKFTHFRIL